MADDPKELPSLPPIKVIGTKVRFLNYNNLDEFNIAHRVWLNGGTPEQEEQAVLVYRQQKAAERNYEAAKLQVEAADKIFEAHLAQEAAAAKALEQATVVIRRPRRKPGQKITISEADLKKAIDWILKDPKRLTWKPDSLVVELNNLIGITRGKTFWTDRVIKPAKEKLSQLRD